MDFRVILMIEAITFGFFILVALLLNLPEANKYLCGVCHSKTKRGNIIIKREGRTTYYEQKFICKKCKKPTTYKMKLIPSNDNNTFINTSNP